MSSEHPDMHGNPMDAPFLCHRCEKEVREDRAYGSDAAPSEMFCSLECVNEWQESQIATLAAERDEARKELAVLKAAPGMEDIDALEKQLDEHYKPKFGMVRRPSEITRDSFDLARRSIAAREEVVGLLGWLWKIIVCNELILSYIRRCDKPEAKAILEIVEGE